MEDNLSKSQRKKLKKQKLELEKLKQKEAIEKKQKIQKIKNFGIAFILIVAIAGFFYLRSIPPKNAPIIVIEPDYLDFGPVSQAKGTVSKTVSLSNEGNEDLIIKNMDTSCGCTSASIVFNDIEGPKFGMASHGTNPRNWEQIIAPGESAQLKVYYDPNVHKDMRGQVERVVFVYSNDPRNNKKPVRISVLQTD